MGCVWSPEGGFQVVYLSGIRGPVNSESSKSNRIQLSKCRVTLICSPARGRGEQRGLSHGRTPKVCVLAPPG